MTLTHMVVPTDFSQNANLALETAVDLAKKYQAKITVVYVIPQVIFHPDWAVDLEDTLDLDNITEEARKALEKTIEPYGQEVNITGQVLSGGPYVEIIRAARQLSAELIVIGAHGTADRKPSLMGSVAEKVVRQAPCSVLAVRESH